jgi:hypothetical protein
MNATSRRRSAGRGTTIHDTLDPLQISSRCILPAEVGDVFAIARRLLAAASGVAPAIED